MNKVIKFIISAILCVVVYGLVWVALMLGGGYIDTGSPAWTYIAAAVVALGVFVWSAIKISKAK